MSHRSRFLGSFALGVLILLSQAAAANAITVSPLIFDFSLEPKSVSQGVIHVVNDSDAPATYYASVQNFVAQGEEGQQQFLQETTLTGLASWISLDQTSFKLAPHETKDFQWAIRIPDVPEPGGHYAAIFFSNAPPKGPDAPSVGVSARAGVLFLVNIAGQVTEAGAVESFNVLNPFVTPARSVSELDRLPALFELRVRNAGTVHFAPAGTIDVTNVFGSTVAKIPANPDNRKILPQSIRRIEALWGPPPEHADGFFANLGAEWKAFALGRYTATLHGTYGADNLPLTAVVSFWIFPWRIALVALLILLFLGLLLHGYNRFIVRRAMSHEESAHGHGHEHEHEHAHEKGSHEHPKHRQKS